jgi:LysR family transcriptional regulator, nod-box dependent transcriptional activator
MVRFNRFDLNLLVTLEALLIERSVTRAAERLCVTQPAVSASLSKLREFFRDPLLVRAGRDLELTPRGRALLGPVQQMLSNAHAILGSHAVFDPSSERRTFTLLSPPDVAAWLAPPILRRILKWAPSIGLEVELPSVEKLARLAQGNLDFLVSIDGTEQLPLPSLPDSLCRAFVTVIRYMGVGARDNAALQEPLSSEALLAMPQVIVRPYGSVSLLERTADARFGVKLDARVLSEDPLNLPYVIGGTALVGIVPEPLARQFGRFADIQVFDLPEGLMPTSHLDLFWHRSYQSDPGHAWFRGVVLNECTAP